jgi:uncharacterized protein with ATP-grasp and redox domains
MRYATNDPALQERLLKEVLGTLSKMDMGTPPPLMTQRIHRFIRARTSSEDPYRDAKEQFNRLALELYPEMKSRLRKARDPLEAAVKLSIAGNMIDLGARSHISEADIQKALNEALGSPLRGELPIFRRAIKKAAHILYLTDNAGEIVLDRLLIEELPFEKITACVRGAPILNDATMSDAMATGLTQIVTVIENGSDAPGTVLTDCSREFNQLFNKADVVIAKGQGNYETLSDEEKEIYFLLKVKCPIVAQDLGRSLSSLVLHRSVYEERTL